MPEVRAHRSGTFCWADLPTTDLDHAIAFYSELFNWRAVDAETPEGFGRYVLFLKDGKTVAATYEMEAELRDNGVPAHWESFLATKAVDEQCARAAELGATVIAPPFDMPGVARMAVLQDPEGATFTLYQAEGEIGSQLLNEPGALCWFELYSRDLEVGPKFYADLFGYELKPLKGPGGEPYVMFGIGKAVAAGAMQIRPEWGQMPPAWMPYFQTEDLEAAVARAESHGGAMLMAPMDLPYVGRCALLQDPQGAIFMALQRGAAPAKPAPAKAEVVEEVEEVEEVEALEEIDDAEEVAQADVDAGDDDDDDIAAQVEADLVSADAGEPDEAEADDDEADADAGDETADDDETPADEADADDDANHHNA
ncbi:MAG: VOC family protein [Myxococcales bacterium]|nr:VOC family protein [Myxococcales bacterium]